MLTSHLRLKQCLAMTAVALAGFTTALPALADDVDWAVWDNVVPSVFPANGSATASFSASSLTASYDGELRSGTSDSLEIYSLVGPSHTITFSETVLNPVFKIWNLVSGSSINSFTFDHAATLLSGSLHLFGSNVVDGTPSGADGVVQFMGSFSSISWTNECVQLGVRFSVGTPVAPVPEPATYALMAAGLGALGFVTRRRRQPG